MGGLLAENRAVQYGSGHKRHQRHDDFGEAQRQRFVLLSDTPATDGVFSLFVPLLFVVYCSRYGRVRVAAGFFLIFIFGENNALR